LLTRCYLSVAVLATRSRKAGDLTGSGDPTVAYHRPMPFVPIGRASTSCAPRRGIPRPVVGTRPTEPEAPTRNLPNVGIRRRVWHSLSHFKRDGGAARVTCQSPARPGTAAHPVLLLDAIAVATNGTTAVDFFVAGKLVGKGCFGGPWGDVGAAGHRASLLKSALVARGRHPGAGGSDGRGGLRPRSTIPWERR
jgi:hypothetical protein